jgi:hypothetical protein
MENVMERINYYPTFTLTSLQEVSSQNMAYLTSCMNHRGCIQRPLKGMGEMKLARNMFKLCEISGSDGGKHEVTLYTRKLSTFMPVLF